MSRRRAWAIATGDDESAKGVHRRRAALGRTAGNGERRAPCVQSNSGFAFHAMSPATFGGRPIIRMACGACSHAHTRVTPR